MILPFEVGFIRSKWLPTASEKVHPRKKKNHDDVFKFVQGNVPENLKTWHNQLSVDISSPVGRNANSATY